MLMEKKIQSIKVAGQPLNVTLKRGANWSTIKELDFGGENVTFADKLSGVTSVTRIANGAIVNDNCANLFQACTNLTDFDCTLPNIISGNNAFVRCHITTFDTNVDSLENGSSMFYNCSSLTSFYTELPSLVNGNKMFNGCSSLTSFDTDLPSLVSGSEMFVNCSNLQSFNAEMPKLVSGDYMFRGCSSLTSFSATLPELVGGISMFIDCTSLTDIYLNLPKVINQPINGAYPALTSLTYFRPSYSGMVSFASINNYPVLKKVTASTNVSASTSISSCVHSGITDAHFIFYNATKLYNICSGGTSLTSVTIEARHLQEANCMFKGCVSLSGVNLTIGDSKLTSASGMFSGCTSLSSIDIDLSNLTNGNGMLYGCTSLTSFSAEMPHLTAASSILNGCSGLTDVYFSAPILSANPIGGSYPALTAITLGIPSYSGSLQLNSTTNYPQLQMVNLTTNWSGSSSNGTGAIIIGEKTTDATLCYNNATYLNRICYNASALTRVSIICPNLALPTTKSLNPLGNCPALQHVEITTKSANSGWTLDDVSYGTTPALQYRYVDDLGDGLVRLVFTSQARPEPARTA